VNAYTAEEAGQRVGASLKEIDRTYGHLVRDSEQTIRARLEARGAAEAERQTGQ